LFSIKNDIFYTEKCQHSDALARYCDMFNRGIYVLMTWL